MSTPRHLTRSSVLGKRSLHAVDDDETSPVDDETSDADALPTPNPTPRAKRAKTTIIVEDGTSNKENIPPFVSLLASPSPRRCLRRSATDATVASSSRTSLQRSTSALSLPPTTPATAISRLNISTPPDSPPSALIPLHARARGLLRTTCNSTAAIAGRDTERATISEFLASFLAAKAGHEKHASTLYISGLPGTGKTALVNDVLRSIELDGAIVVSVNCMALKDVSALWDRLQEDLGALAKPRGRGRPKKLLGQDAVGKALKDLTSKCVVILDELDHIAKTPALLDDLFALTHEHKETIRIIGIANTHTLTASSVKAGSGSGVQTLHFSAYTGQQLVEIVQSRLEPLYEEAEQAAAMKKLLPVPALMLLAKKIAAQTGDVRAVFEVLRGAIDLAVVESAVIAAPAVTPKHVLSAFKLYAPTTSQTAMPTGISAASGPAANSELAMQVRQLGLHARVVLLALVLATRRSQCGLPLIGSASNTHASPTKSPVKRAGSATALPSANAGMVEAGALHAFYAATLARGDSVAFTPVSRSEFADLLGMLETVGLVALSSAGGTPGSPSKSGRRALGRAASFGGAKTTVAAGAQEARIADGVRLDEVLLGLGCTGGQLDTPAGADPREEELRALWGREQARITREAKTRPAGAQTDVFTEATED